MELTEQKQPTDIPAEQAGFADEFRCRCGTSLNTIMKTIDRDGGMLVWDEEKDKIEERVGTLLSNFTEALRSKRKRLAWLQSYYGSDYEGDLTDVEVLFEVLLRAESQESHAVLRCPSCGRLYVGPNSSDGTWQCFRPEDGREAE